MTLCGVRSPAYGCWSMASSKSSSRKGRLFSEHMVTNEGCLAKMLGLSRCYNRRNGRGICSVKKAMER